MVRDRVRARTGDTVRVRGQKQILFKSYVQLLNAFPLTIDPNFDCLFCAVVAAAAVLKNSGSNPGSPDSKRLAYTTTPESALSPVESSKLPQ